MKYFLDTNICIYIINRRDPKILARLFQFEPEQIAVSTVVVAELEYGVAKSKHFERNRQRLEDFLLPFVVTSFDQAASRAYGAIRADLENKGMPIGREDMMIAAHALSADATLVTNNEREFMRVDALKVENWGK